MILCDIDFFKFYNDQYGHPAGDECLQKVGAVLSRKAQKHQDLVARYGGEEFAVIMPYTHSSGAVHVAKTIQAGVKNLQIVHDGFCSESVCHPQYGGSYCYSYLGILTFRFDCGSR